jgi:integrase
LSNPVEAPPRPDPKTIDVKRNGTTYSFTYWKTKWTNKRTRRVYPSYVISYNDGLKPRREKRATFKALRERAEEIALQKENNETARLQLTPADQASYLRSRELAAKVAAPVELLVAEAVEARLARAGRIERKTVEQIFTELLAAKKAEGAGLRWVDDLDSRLSRFKKDFTGPLCEISDDDVRLWLTRLNLSRRSWNNNRTALLALVAFARERKYVPADWSGLATVKPYKLTKPVEEIYTPEQIRSLLFTAEKNYPRHLAALAIMAFAGCRHCELRDAENALDWKDVHLKTAKIHISESLAKSNTGRRYVPMQPNLCAWLEPYVKPRGPVCEVENLTNAFARIADKAKITWKQNALRNSFISYRCAATQNVPQVASEAGNSVAEIQKSYRRELTQEEGQSWFEIMPTRADVLPLFAYGKVE